MAVTLQVKPVTLTGQIVCLEPLSEAHVSGLSEVGLDGRIWELTRYPYVRTKEDLRGWVLDMLQRQSEGQDLPFAVIHLASGKPVGATRYLDIHPEDRNLEIGGTWYGVDYQRTGVNTESKYLLLKHAFEALGCIRVFFKTDVLNERSQRAIERLGAVKEGIVRNHIILPDGRIRSSVFYSILVEEWPSVKSRLESMLTDWQK